MLYSVHNAYLSPRQRVSVTDTSCTRSVRLEVGYEWAAGDGVVATFNELECRRLRDFLTAVLDSKERSGQ